MLYLSNAFSLQMLNTTKAQSIQMMPLTVQDVQEILQKSFTSCIGHQDTANVISSILGVQIPMNRINVSLNTGDTLIVAQITGGRLPEGATTLPVGTDIQFLHVTLNGDNGSYIPVKKLAKKNTRGIIVTDEEKKHYYFVPYRKRGEIEDSIIDRVLKEIKIINPSFIENRDNIGKALVEENDFTFSIGFLPYKGGNRVLKSDLTIINITF